MSPTTQPPPPPPEVPPEASPEAPPPPGMPSEVLQGAAVATAAAPLDELSPCARFVERVPIGYARRHGVMGFDHPDEAQGVLLAMADTSCVEVADNVGRVLDRPPWVIPAARDAIERAINAAYEEQTGQTDALLDELDRDRVLTEIASLPTHADLLDATSPGGGGKNDSGEAVIRLVNLLLFEAVKLRASDVHVQPYEDRVVVRMRIDGVLFDMFTLPAGAGSGAVKEGVASRIKIMGEMNIAEKRLPQDGRATVTVGERVIDLRISSVPTSHGERMVIRLLDKSAKLYTLEEIGMDDQTLARFRQLIKVEHGLVLVTGPTGSGKSTTLYAGLQEIDATAHNIITLEDPIEYQLPGISQIQVNEKKGMTFASGLRSVLRQDPDIIMVGEVRDKETAVMSIQSALTGHLVYSTLHTNDAASAITRLLDLGIEPYLASSSVIAVLAQRLVRRVCEDCAEPAPMLADEAKLESLGVEASALDMSRARRGRGCDACRGTGFRGRVGLFELLTVDADIRRHVQARDTAAQLKETAIRRGMTTLREDGLRKIAAGVTTVEEVVRVTMRATV